MFRLQIGTWDSAGGINFTKKYSDSVEKIVDSLLNRTLIITTILVIDFNWILLLEISKYICL